MEIIPLIHMKNRKAHLENKGENASIGEILGQLNKDSNVYFLDIDGLENNKPNLCTYQRLIDQENMWVDTGPRVLGDVVDAVMAGAASITVRQNLWPKVDIEKIKEFTENKIYLGINFKDKIKNEINTSLQNEIDGVVLLNNKDEIEKNFKISDSVKNMASKLRQHKLYVYDSNPENVYYWEKRGAVGLLVDIDKIERFKNHGF